MNDVLITKFTELDQTVVVLAGEDYVVLRVDFHESELLGEPGKFDRTLLLGPAGAERLANAFARAATRAREAS